MRYVWVNPAAPRSQYITAVANDPNHPAGYVLTTTSDGSATIVDGIKDENSRKYTGGLMSGGFPAYNGYGDGSTSNGILGGGNR